MFMYLYQGRYSKHGSQQCPAWNVTTTCLWIECFVKWRRHYAGAEGGVNGPRDNEVRDIKSQRCRNLPKYIREGLIDVWSARLGEGRLSSHCQQRGKAGHISRRVSHIPAPASFVPRIQGHSTPSPSLKFRPQSTLKLKIRRQAGPLSNSRTQNSADSWSHDHPSHNASRSLRYQERE